MYDGYLISASKVPFNWLTGSSLDTFTDYSSVGSETSSSLLFTVGTQDMALRARLKPSRKPGPGFGKSRPGTSKHIETTSKGNTIIMQIYRKFVFWEMFAEKNKEGFTCRWIQTYMYIQRKFTFEGDN